MVARRQDVVYMTAPQVRDVKHSEVEIRFDLPDGSVDGLYYFGLVIAETWNTGAHFHDHFEICLVERGVCLCEVDGRSFAAEQGDLIIARPGEVHMSAAGGPGPFHLFFAGFDLRPKPELLLAFYRQGVACVRGSDGLVPLFQLILQELEHPTLHSSEMLQGVFLQMLVGILRLCSSHAMIMPGGKALSGPIRDALIKIHTSATFNLGTDELAEEIGYSRSHLEREFKSRLGVSVGRYIRQLCLEEARKRLVQTASSVTSIAEELGFESIHGFSLFFKRHTGYSPLEYRHLQYRQNR